MRQSAIALNQFKGVGVDMHEFKHERESRVSQSQQAGWQAEKLEMRQPHPLIPVLLMAWGSLVLGLIPILYGATLGQTATSTPILVPHQASLWSVLGERE
ncbi:MAG TPA: hypothetical protein V6D50_09995 [Chroococcales cyanobacterium]|jgi:hypothetical protein